MTEIIIQTGIALAFVVFLIFAVALLYKKRRKNIGILNLIAYQSLGQKMGVAALKIGGEVLILGITPTDFKLLRKLDEKAIEIEETETASNFGSIAERVKKIRRIKEEI